MRSSSLGTQLRHLVEILDGAVQQSYIEAGLDYRPRYTPIMRQLIAAEPLTVGQIVKTAQVTQAAVTQTIGLMANDGLVRVTQGNDDGRQRFVSLTDRGRRMIKKLQQCWDATAMAHADLERELGFSLSTVLDQAITALEHKPYLTRIREARASLAK